MALRFVFVFLFCIGNAVAQLQPASPSTPTSAAPASKDPKALASIEGRTLGVDGSPLRKTTLTLRPSMSGSGEMPQGFTTTSDAEGKFIFDGIDAGRYTLQGQHPGYSQSTYGAKKGSGAGTMLTVTPGQHMRDVNFSLTLQAVISGKVLDDEGDPVSRAQVQVLQRVYSNGKRQAFPAGQAQTDDDGTYKISTVRPGRYFFSAAPPRMNTYENLRKAGPVDAGKPEEDLITTFYPGVLDLNEATAIEVVAGRDMPGTDIRLRKSAVFRVKGKIGGSLPADSGQRLRVIISRRDAYVFNIGGPSTAVVEKDGSFELRGVSPGSYSLVATTMQGMMKTLGRQNLEVGNRNVDDIALIVQPGGSLRGSVRLERSPAADSSQPPPDLSRVRVNLNASAGLMTGVPQGSVKADGTFSFEDVAAEKYRLNVYGNPDGTYLKSARLGNQDVLAGDMDLSGGIGGATLDIVIGPGAGQIEGTVQDDKQQQAPGTVLSLVPDPLDTYKMYLYKVSTTDQNGHFVIANVAPGKYRLYAWEDIENGGQFDPDFMKKVEDLGPKVTVDENGHVTQALTRISVAQMEQARAK
jgi:Carboxypeptidase regulatory-like domain/Polysaccharide lyase family 4, domain II